MPWKKYGTRKVPVVVMAEPKPVHIEKSARMLTRERVTQEAKDAGFQLDTLIEDQLKDNIFILRPIVADAAESGDRQQVRALWENYLAWAKTTNGGKSPRDYAVSLDKEGIPAPEIRRDHCVTQEIMVRTRRTRGQRGRHHGRDRR